MSDSTEKFKFIDKVGLEIEGCWPKMRKDLIEDGSLRDHEFTKPYHIDESSGTKLRLFGELLSTPIDNLNGVMDFLDKNWVSETGKRCGFHIHVSLKSFDLYCNCMSKEFYNAFVKRITSWGRENCPENRTFWERLCDLNEYCRDVFIPDVQAAITKKTVVDRRRYCMLNYCWGMHKTIECRLFPTFLEVETAKSATLCFIQSIEDYCESIVNKGKLVIVDEDLDKDETILSTNSEFQLPNFSLFQFPVKNKIKINNFSGRILSRAEDLKPWDKPRDKKNRIPDDILKRIEAKERNDALSQAKDFEKAVFQAKSKSVKKPSQLTAVEAVATMVDGVKVSGIEGATRHFEQPEYIPYNPNQYITNTPLTIQNGIITSYYEAVSKHQTKKNVKTPKDVMDKMTEKSAPEMKKYPVYNSTDEKNGEKVQKEAVNKSFDSKGNVATQSNTDTLDSEIFNDMLTEPMPEPILKSGRYAYKTPINEVDF